MSLFCLALLCGLLQVLLMILLKRLLGLVELAGVLGSDLLVRLRTCL